MDMNVKYTKIARLRDFARRTGILQARDLQLLGIPKRYLGRLCDEGFLTKTGRGVYMTSNSPETIHLGLALAEKSIPKSVICLLSALRFHEIGTQIPHKVWIAMDRRAAHPRGDISQLRIVRFSGKALTEGIEEHEIAGVRVRIYNPAKTIADCFKYRNKIGLDVALEALRQVIQERKCTADDLWKYANICRVSRVIRPYLEALM